MEANITQNTMLDKTIYGGLCDQLVLNKRGYIVPNNPPMTHY